MSADHLENAQSPCSSSEDEIDLLELLSVLWDHKLLICLFTAVISALVIAYAMNLKNIYKAEARFLPPKEANSKLTGVMNQLSSISFLGMLGGGGDSVDSLEVLKSYLLKRDSLDLIFKEFDLKRRFKIETNFFIDVQKIFESALSIEKDKESGIVTISYEDSDPEFAARMVNYLLERMVEITKKSVITENKKKMIFLENRYRETELNLLKSEDELRDFQKKNKLLKIDSQAEATIEAASKLQSEILVNRIRMKVKLELGTNEAHPDIRLLKLEIDALEKQLKGIESGSLIVDENRKDQALTYISLETVPDLQLAMERLMRTKIMHQEVFKVLAKELEMAKIEASKDQEVLEIIDQAFVPERKFKPKRLIIFLVGAISGFLLACFFVLVRNAFKKGVIRE